MYSNGAINENAKKYLQFKRRFFMFLLAFDLYSLVRKYANGFFFLSVNWIRRIEIDFSFVHEQQTNPNEKNAIVFNIHVCFYLRDLD